VQSSTDAPKVQSVADEVALLARVQQKLRDGQGRAAFEAIDEANRRFARSQLEPDFQAARVLALCEMGQVTSARRAANDFLRAHASSPMSDRVRHSCAFSDDSAESARKDRSEGKLPNGSPR
jgi:outer membrane protein assembly factor BamD (BamD/ComL family)